MCNDIAIEISVDDVRYRIELEQDVFGWAWEMRTFTKGMPKLLRTYQYGEAMTRQEALDAAMALIDLATESAEMDAVIAGWPLDVLSWSHV